jgi:hypothetical protein
VANAASCAVALALLGVAAHRQRGQQRVAVGVVLVRRGHADLGAADQDAADAG